MLLPVVRSPLGLPLGGPGLLPGPPALPGCWPEAYILQYCGSLLIPRTLLDTYTSHRSSGVLGGASAPPGSINENPLLSAKKPTQPKPSKNKTSSARSWSGGASPSFRSSCHWEGMAPLRGINSGGFPFNYSAMTPPRGKQVVAPPTDNSRGPGGPLNIPGGIPLFQYSTLNLGSSGPNGQRTRVWGASPCIVP